MKSLLFVLLCLLLLPSCKDNTTETLFNTYQQRLTNVLDITPIAVPALTLPSYPDTRSLRQPLADLRMGLLDAYELRRCGLFQLIAERNSVLGKVQDQTRRLRYELLFLKQLNHCLAVLNSTSELQSQLNDIYQQKQQQLPLMIWNMVFTGKEWRQQFILGHQLLELQQFSGYIETVTAVNYLDTLTTTMTAQTISQALTTLTPNYIEQLLYHQQQIHTTQYLGQLFYSMAQITAMLNTITIQLTQHENNIICGKNINQQQAQYLRNVFYKYYVHDIQPYLSKLQSQYQQLQPYLDSLYTTLIQHHAQPPAIMTLYARYYFQGELQRQFQQATIEHVRYWQRLFKRCQFQVGHQ
ncbi:DUF3080 domain-containing protein [Photobacterium toruni]|uniref:DUF3080 domain-containing protein n=1 Tax=Photobacterium toruni TaxID=1935446 RepID=UPI002E177262|nr:DUF3080 domain-containing protein [Photobacterium toruni]